MEWTTRLLVTLVVLFCVLATITVLLSLAHISHTLDVLAGLP